MARAEPPKRSQETGTSAGRFAGTANSICATFLGEVLEGWRVVIASPYVR